MKSYFKFLCRNKLYTSIEVIGMAIAIAFVVFIGTFILNGYRTDYDIKKQGNIYVGDFDGYFLHTYPTKDILTGKFPEIKDMCRIMDISGLRGVTMDLFVGDEKMSQNGLVVDENFFRFFPFPLSQGDSEDVLKTSSILVSESYAKRCFGNQSALGKSIRLRIDGNEEEVMVTGIFKDFHHTMFPTPEIIYSFDAIKKMYPSLIHPGNGTVTLFFQLMEGTHVDNLVSKMESVLKEEESFFSSGIATKYRLTRYEDIPDLESVSLWQPFRNIINPDFIDLFTAIGILLLLFSTLNYISLTVAQTGFRAKEMASRRLLGAYNTDIIGRYLIEAFILTSISFLLALALIQLFTPWVSELAGMNLSPFAEGAGYIQILLMLGLVILLSFLSGIIPAWIISQYRPIDVVRGNFTRASKMILGKVLVGIQSAIAFITLVLAVSMGRQLTYMIERPMGYERNSIVSITSSSYNDFHVNELKQLPCVEKVGFIQNVPMMNGATVLTLQKDGKEYKMDVLYGDKTAFDILGFNVIELIREPEKQDMWLTETAMNSLRLSTETMKEYNFCGVISDYKKGSANSLDGGGFPKAYKQLEIEDGKYYQYLRTMIVKVYGDEKEARRMIRDFYQSQPHYDATKTKISLFNELNEQQYGAEYRNVKLLAGFSVITLLLTVLSLFAISTFYARQHTKSVALRKIMGCSKEELYRDVCMNFLKSIIIAILAAAPVAYWIAGKWLEDYNYRIDNSLVVYFVVMVVILLIAIFSVSWQVIKLMNINPVQLLKTE